MFEKDRVREMRDAKSVLIIVEQFLGKIWVKGQESSEEMG